MLSFGFKIGTIKVLSFNIHSLYLSLDSNVLLIISFLQDMILKVYVSGDQLPKVKIGQKCQVLIDKNEKENTKYEGMIEWVSDNAEFTPKIIQTKEERVNLVYAVKVKVKNDGTLKIGMPGEVNFK